MAKKAPLFRRNGNVPHKQVEDDGMLLDLETGNYFEVNSVGLFIWECLGSEISEEQIAKRLSSEFSIPVERALKDTRGFLTLLRRNKLVDVH